MAFESHSYSKYSIILINYHVLFKFAGSGLWEQEGHPLYTLKFPILRTLKTLRMAKKQTISNYSLSHTIKMSIVETESQKSSHGMYIYVEKAVMKSY